MKIDKIVKIKQLGDMAARQWKCDFLIDINNRIRLVENQIADSSTTQLYEAVALIDIRFWFGEEWEWKYGIDNLPEFIPNFSEVPLYAENMNSILQMLKLFISLAPGEEEWEAWQADGKKAMKDYEAI